MAKVRKRKRLSKTEKKKPVKKKRAKVVKKPKKKVTKKPKKKVVKPKKKVVKKKSKKKVSRKPRKTPKIETPPPPLFLDRPPREAPSGFEPIELPDSVGIANRITEVLNNARLQLADIIDTHVPMVHPYDPIPEKGYLGEVDGEWRADVLRGETTPEVLRAMMEALDWPVLGEGFWITVGLRFHGKSEYDEVTGDWSFADEEEQHYNKDRGMLDVSSNYRPMISKARTLSAFNAILEGSSKNPTPMWESVEKKFKRKVSQVYIRINWNPQNRQPKR